MVNKINTSSTVEQFKRHTTDTGSVEVQVALITERINHLNNNHFDAFPKDRASRVGLMKLVGQRRRLLDYLRRNDEERYDVLIKQLGIRR